MLRVADPPGPPPEIPGHLAELEAELVRAGFKETYRDERPGGFGNWMVVYERKPVRVRIIRDGKEGQWFAQLNAKSWKRDAWGEAWVDLPPLIEIPTAGAR